MVHGTVTLSMCRDLWQILLLIMNDIASKISSWLLTVMAFGILCSLSIDDWFYDEQNKRMVKQTLFIIKSIIAIIAVITFRCFVKWDKVCFIDLFISNNLFNLFYLVLCKQSEIVGSCNYS